MYVKDFVKAGDLDNFHGGTRQGAQHELFIFTRKYPCNK